MAFRLEVEFTGLCLYVRRPEVEGKKKLTVLMPDCRRSYSDSVHDDGSLAEPHVGYLRVDLANLVDKFPTADEMNEPRGEVIYRFDRQELDLGIADDSNMTFEPLGLPSFNTILKTPPRAELFDAVPPDDLLFRTVLCGGEIRGKRGNGHWAFRDVKIEVNGKNGKTHAGQFSEVITWTRTEIPGESLTLKISAFSGAKDPVPITLHARNNIIRLKIANLCSTNPLEWDGLIMHVVRDTDNDFKWLYRLFPKNGAKLHVPRMSGYQALGAEDCLGGFYP
jgi:hypothetical protein